MTCLQILFLVSLVAFVGVGIYTLFIGQRLEPAFPPVVDPWDTKGRRISDPKQTSATHKGATNHENSATDRRAGATRATAARGQPGS